MTFQRFTLQNAAGESLGELVGDYAKYDGLVGTIYEGQEVAHVVDSTPVDAAYEEAAKSVRQQRNLLLAESDWTQLADAPVDQAAWTTYRQALRDVPAQVGFPEAVVWPVAPN